jgi:hypothetical protein
VGAGVGITEVHSSWRQGDGSSPDLRDKWNARGVCLYFWRRLCVIACEDVGPADDVLASFVVACSTVFPPKKTGSENYRLFCFLAEQMCDLPTLSRIYCSYGVIGPAAIKSELPELTAEDKTIVSAIMQNRAAVEASQNPWRQWQTNTRSSVATGTRWATVSRAAGQIIRGNQTLGTAPASVASAGR